MVGYRWWRVVVGAVVGGLLLSGAALSVSLGDAEAGGGRGSICNKSSTGIIALVEDNIDPRTGKGQWKTMSFAPGACSNRDRQDVEGIWGQRCDANGRCQQTAFKLGSGSYTITDVRNSGRSWRVVKIEGWGWGNGWGAPSEWPRPQMTLAYEITR